MKKPTAGSALWIALVRYRRRQVLLVCLAGFILAVSVCGVDTLRNSALSAQERAARADQAGYGYAIQGGTERARTALAATPHLLRANDVESTVSTEASETPALVRTLSAPGGPVGALLEGRRADAPGEATVSMALARGLRLTPGESADVTTEGQTASVQVVGVTVNEAGVDDLSVVVVADGLSPQDTTVWLSRTDPYADPSLRPLLDDRSITYRSVSSLEEAARRSIPPAVAGLRYAPTVAGLVCAVLILVVLSAMAPTARADATSLVQAGVPPRRAWGVIARLTSAILISGIVLGCTATTLAVWLGRVSLSKLVGQYWVTVDVPWIPAAALILLVVGGSAATRPVLSARQLVVEWVASPARPRASPRMHAIMLAGVGAALIAIAATAHLQEPPSSLAGWAPVGVVMVVAALPKLIGALSISRLSPAASAVARRLAGAFSLVAVIASVIAVASAGSAARTTHNANAGEGQTSAPQPPGSFLIYEIPDAAAQRIVERYVEAGGHHAQQYGLPDEGQRRIRVTGTMLVECMEEAQTLIPDAVSADCFPQNTLSPVNTVMLALDDQAGSRADPGLIQDGEVGLLEYTGARGEAESIATTDATADPLLGGNMPGMVVDVDSRVAQQFGLHSGGTRLVALLGFHDLGTREQLVMRRIIAKLAPGAQTADWEDGTSYDQDRSIANVKAVAGSALALIVLMSGGSAVLAGHRVTRRILIDIGSDQIQRLRPFLAWIAAPALTLVLGIPLTVLSTTISGINLSGDWGYLWLLPFMCGFIGCAVLTAMAMRVPNRVGE